MKYFIASSIFSAVAFIVLDYVHATNVNPIVVLPLMALPGILFSLALLISSPIKISRLNGLLFVISSVLIWGLCYAISFNVFYLILVPISGGLGIFLFLKAMDIILSLRMKSIKNKMIAGLLSAIVGLAFFHLTQFLDEVYEIKLQSRMMFIILFWQLVLGYLLTKDFKNSNYTIAEQ